MQSKNFEYIIVYLSVLLSCALIGIIVRFVLSRLKLMNLLQP